MPVDVQPPQRRDRRMDNTNTRGAGPQRIPLVSLPSETNRPVALSARWVGGRRRRRRCFPGTYLERLALRQVSTLASDLSFRARSRSRSSRRLSRRAFGRWKRRMLSCCNVICGFKAWHAQMRACAADIRVTVARPASNTISPCLKAAALVTAPLCHSGTPRIMPTVSKRVFFMLDSGCEVTCTRDRASFTTFTPCRVPLQQAGGESIFALGKGIAHGVHCLYVPKLAFTGLLSTAEICDSAPDTKVVHTRKGIYVTRGGKRVAAGHRRDNLYYLCPDDLGAPSVSSASTRPCNRALLWHRRLNHVAWNELLRIKNAGRLKGVKFSRREWKEAQEHDFCKGCVEGKLTKKPMRIHRDPKRADSIFQRVHADLCFYGGGIVDRNRCTCVLVIVDEFSGAVWCYPLERKSDTLAAFKLFMDRVTGGRGVPAISNPGLQKMPASALQALRDPTRLGTLRSDNGSEFVSREFFQYLDNCGVHIERFTPVEGHCFRAE